MTDDGKKVFFTSNEDLTDDNSDTDSSIDLYMWSENNGAPTVTDISAGSGGIGNTDGCHAAWTEAAISGSPRLRWGVGLSRSSSCPGLSDPCHAIAAMSTSPRRSCSMGRPTASRTARTFTSTETGRSTLWPGLRSTALVRSKINVSPDGFHAAFATKSRLTAYDNAGFRELYSFDFSRRGDRLPRVFLAVTRRGDVARPDTNTAGPSSHSTAASSCQTMAGRSSRPRTRWSPKTPTVVPMYTSTSRGTHS